MHVPDGFLSNRIALSLDVLSGATILYAARRVRLDRAAQMIPVMGVLSAFIFAAQMLNFPVFGGTSGHLVGGALLSIILGPMAGLLTMTTVIIGQALFMQDGGLVALGANLFNIGAVTAFSGYATYRLLGAPETRGKHLLFAGFMAGWTSVVLSASACAFELALSGAVPLRVGLPAMAGYHAVIGVAEGGLSAGVLSFLARVRPDLIRHDFRPAFGVPDWIGGIVLVAIPLGILALGESSRLPDPLQALLSPAARPDRPENLLTDARYAYSGVVLYLALLLLCCLAYFAVRTIRNRRRPS